DFDRDAGNVPRRIVSGILSPWSPLFTMISWWIHGSDRRCRLNGKNSSSFEDRYRSRSMPETSHASGPMRWPSFRSTSAAVNVDARRALTAPANLITLPSHTRMDDIFRSEVPQRFGFGKPDSDLAFTPDCRVV